MADNNHQGFNYCFWGKLLVAVPAIGIIAIWAASFFENAPVQIAAGGVAAFIAMFVAAKIDQMPMFSGKICKR